MDGFQCRGEFGYQLLCLLKVERERLIDSATTIFVERAQTGHQKNCVLECWKLDKQRLAVTLRELATRKINNPT